MPLLALTDSQLGSIMRAAQPLEPHERGEFLRAVAAALAQHPAELGDGLVGRVCRELQRQYREPPDLSRGAGSGKWARA